MKQKLLISLCVILFTGITVSALTEKGKEKYSIKRFKTEGTKKLKPGAKMELFFASDSLQKPTTQKVVHGRLISLDEKNLTVGLGMEYNATRYSLDTVKETYCKLSHEPATPYDISTIEYMNYEPKVKTVFEVLAYASVISALVLSPLIAYDIATNDFSGSMYVSAVAPSLVACAVTIPLYFGFEQRKIRFLK